MVQKTKTAAGGALWRIVSDEAEALMVNIQAELMENTPVDTGWAKNNWLPSVGTPIDDPKGTPESVEEETTGVVVFSKWKLGEAMFLTNNVPYIQRLDGGHSAQAPAGFVDKSIQTEIDKLNKKGT